VSLLDPHQRSRRAIEPVVVPAPASPVASPIGTSPSIDHDDGRQINETLEEMQVRHAIHIGTQLHERYTLARLKPRAT